MRTRPEENVLQLSPDSGLTRSKTYVIDLSLIDENLAQADKLEQNTERLPLFATWSIDTELSLVEKEEDSKTFIHPSIRKKS